MMKLKKTLHYGIMFAIISLIINSLQFVGINIDKIDTILNWFGKFIATGDAQIIMISAFFWFAVGFFLAFFLIPENRIFVKDVSKSLDKYLKPETKKLESKDLDIKICPECKEEINISMKKCPNCGAEQFDDDLTED